MMLLHVHAARPRPAPQRWAISLADLALLLVCVVYTSGQQATQAPASPRVYAQFAPDRVFVPGEARLHPAGQAYVQSLARALSPQSRPTIGVPVIPGPGRDDAARSARYDNWELAAARTAAIGRVFASATHTASAPVLAAPAMDQTSPNIRITVTSTADQTGLAQSLLPLHHDRDNDAH